VKWFAGEGRREKGEGRRGKEEEGRRIKEEERKKGGRIKKEELS
jgi:hypothetical protein